MIQIAPPHGVISVSDNAPHVLTYSFNTGCGLTPAGLIAVSSAVTTYLSVGKKAAIGRELFRHGGTAVAPDAILGTSAGSYPVLNADVLAQVSALAALIAAAGAAG